MANPMFRGKGPIMLKTDYSPAFPLKHQQKDMRLALSLGDENAVSMPVAAAANEVVLFSHIYLHFLMLIHNIVRSSNPTFIFQLGSKIRKFNIVR